MQAGAGGAGRVPRSEEVDERSAFSMWLHPISAPALGPPWERSAQHIPPGTSAWTSVLFPSLGRA